MTTWAALRFLLPLVLSGGYGKEEPSSLRGGVYGFLKGDKVSIMLSKEISEFQELFGIPGQAGKLWKNKASDMAWFDMIEHFLRLRKAHDRFSAFGLKVIDLFDLPAFGFGIEPGPFLAVLRAFSSGLVFGRDPNPDTDALREFHRKIFLLIYFE